MTQASAHSIAIVDICRRAGMSRQAYYQGLRRSRSKRQTHKKVLEWVRELRASHPRMGGRKLYHRLKPHLQAEDLKMGRDALFELLRTEGLLVKPRKSRAPRTTYGAFSRWTNKLAKAHIDQANQGWVADITYLRTFDGFCYLALISDKYSRKILGWDVAESLELEGALRALSHALRRLNGQTPIHHSDRGSQYRSRQYVNMLKDYHCTISMTEDDHCAENAQAERLNGILKNEYLLDQTFLSVNQAREAARQAIDLYNSDRPHLSLNYQTPDQVHWAA